MHSTEQLLGPAACTVPHPAKAQPTVEALLPKGSSSRAEAQIIRDLPVSAELLLSMCSMAGGRAVRASGRVCRRSALLSRVLSKKRIFFIV